MGENQNKATTIHVDSTKTNANQLNQGLEFQSRFEYGCCKSTPPDLPHSAHDQSKHRSRQRSLNEPTFRSTRQRFLTKWAEKSALIKAQN